MGKLSQMINLLSVYDYMYMYMCMKRHISVSILYRLISAFVFSCLLEIAESLCYSLYLKLLCIVSVGGTLYLFLQMLSAYSLDPDQACHFVEPNLDSVLYQMKAFLKDYEKENR